MFRLKVMLCLLLGAGLLDLAGCTHPPPPLYRPFSQRAGYSEVQIAPARFQVTYQGTPGMSDGAAAELAKLRAAELAHLSGRDYIRIHSVRMSSRTYTDYEPAWYTMDPYYREGHPHYHQRLLRDERFSTYSVPVAVLEVELLDEETEGVLSVEHVLSQGRAWGLIHPPPLNKPEASPGG